MPVTVADVEKCYSIIHVWRISNHVMMSILLSDRRSPSVMNDWSSLAALLEQLLWWLIRPMQERQTRLQRPCTELRVKSVYYIRMASFLFCTLSKALFAIFEETAVMPRHQWRVWNFEDVQGELPPLMPLLALESRLLPLPLPPPSYLRWSAQNPKGSPSRRFSSMRTSRRFIIPMV